MFLPITLAIVFSAYKATAAGEAEGENREAYAQICTAINLAQEKYTAPTPEDHSEIVALAEALELALSGDEVLGEIQNDGATDLSKLKENSLAKSVCESIG
ncbi:Trypanosomal VSG domain containing protein, putative [Trypanosoma equiperdum]|uniref:Trypanosomal VSG domain containing protein, putative n=1 Tax=Trypanosoma equiperdum TaxID=5694 RepID=A0A1G4I3R9_TRYEQ|nr:Trypanosomal VSG domain containing protein, putative [Trypanosoma equiperdum]